LIYLILYLAESSTLGITKKFPELSPESRSEIAVSRRRPNYTRARYRPTPIIGLVAAHYHVKMVVTEQQPAISSIATQYHVHVSTISVTQAYH
jgi:hypothetical protein